MPDPEMLARIVEAVEERIPFNRELGLTGFRVTADEVRLRVPMREALIGNFERQTLHGGVISAVLDVVGGIAALFAATGQFPEDEERAREIFARLGTIDLRIDYLRPGRSEWFDASAEVLRAGRRVAVTRMALHDAAGQLVAVGTGTYIVG